MFGAGGTEQNGGEYHGGGVWRGAARKGNTGYPLGGFRIYSNVAARSVTNGCNFACAVYGTMPSIRDYPEAGSYIQLLTMSTLREVSKEEWLAHYRNKGDRPEDYTPCGN